MICALWVPILMNGLCFTESQFGYKHANYMALENWVNVYDGDLGTALSDTYTSDSFLMQFIAVSRQSCLTVYVVIPAMNTNL